MGKLRETITVVAVALATGGAAGCSSSFWNRDGEPPLVDPGAPSDSESTPPGFADGRTPAPPVRLSTLITAERTPPPISGGGLTVRPDGKLAVMADPDRDAVYLVDTDTLLVRTVALPKGSEPGRVVLDAHGCVHVALRNAGSVVRIDIATAAVTTQTKTCSLPRGVAYDADQDAVLVACSDGQLVSLSAADHAELSRTFVALDLRDVLVSKTGERWVSRYRSAELLRVKADGSIAKQTGPLSSHAMRFDAIDGKGDGFSGPRPSSGPRKVQLSPALAWKTISGPDGAPIMLHQQSQDDEVQISAAGGYGGGGGCTTITQAGITQYDGKGSAGPSMGLGGAALAVDLAVSGTGRWLAIAKPGAYLRGEQPSIEVVAASLSSTTDDGSSDVSEDGGVPTQPGTGPSTGVNVPPSSEQTCTTGWGEGFDMQATGVAFDENDRLYVFSREPAQLRIYDARGSSFDSPSFTETEAVNLSDTSVRDTGHELFHTDVGTGLACASCHGEALDDGHVWNFKDVGPRRTQNMRGGLSKTLPLHWEGDLATFDNLVDEVMTRRMGGFVVEHKYADALSKWLDKQPSLAVVGADPQASARGKKLFESAEVACATCHAGDMLTNNQTVDVGTGGKFQVPSLHGVVLHGPFMHDGCAQTLTDRFDALCGGGDKHGKTSQLSKAQIADLVAYLETL